MAIPVERDPPLFRIWRTGSSWSIYKYLDYYLGRQISRKLRLNRRQSAQIAEKRAAMGKWSDELTLSTRVTSSSFSPR